jgi:hypothetical protein
LFPRTGSAVALIDRRLHHADVLAVQKKLRALGHVG